LELTSDGALLLAAGTPENWGLAIVAGTGSIAVGRAADGRTARAGGWGYLLGDEGSGYRIALAGLQAVAQAADGRGPATVLMESLLRHLHLDTPQALIATLYRNDWSRPRLASLAALVFDTADAGDTPAQQLVAEAAAQLAQTGAAVVRQLGGQEAVPLALAGGCLLASASYREQVVQQLQALGVRIAAVTLVSEPALGAVRLGREATQRDKTAPEVT
jgi:N-acetylglucosamine kinase-like BadF-type ATPase